jgi:diacylglycerol O-acyltransferase / trehalose O-mycolyltransferase / mycolyltransferase Ag85
MRLTAEMPLPTPARVAGSSPWIRLGSSLLAVACALVLSSLPARSACDPPRCRELVVPVPPTISVPDSSVRILLPEDYDSTRERYPVLYLLHGAGDTYATWTELTDVAAYSAQFPIIIVMPDGGHDANAGFYSDWVDGSRQWETFHTRVLRSFVDRNFRTLPGRRHRAVAGLSMGGFGAISYAARHPSLFRVAASFSGALDTLYPSPATNALFVTRVVASGIWGDPAAEEPTWRAHNPPDLAGRLRHVSLFLATGDGTMGGPAGDIENAPGAYGVEQVVSAMTQSFARALDAAGVPYEKDFYRGGYHGWPYWERELHWALPQILSTIGPESAPCRQPLARGVGSLAGGARSCTLPRLVRSAR